MSVLAKIQRRLARVPSLLADRYRRLRLRNAILSIKARTYTERFDFTNKRYVLFLVRGTNFVNGGVMSIFSIASETRNLLAQNGVSVAICTAYSEPRLFRYTKFENDFDILAFADLLPRLPSGAEVLVHIPELRSQEFGTNSLSVYRSRPDLKWRFNILLQNILLIPKRHVVEELATVGPVTATTAHEAYSTPEIAQQLGCPVHFFSWRLSPEDFERIGFDRKRNLIVISPDFDPAKADIVREMSRVLPDHSIVEVRNMTYQEYLDLIKHAKFAFTFGEGLDAYFIEPIFYGGVSMAIFNDLFFPPRYRALDGIFDRQRALASVGDFLKTTNTKQNYDEVAQRQYDWLAKDFNRDRYLGNIRSYYLNYFKNWFR